MGTHTWCIRHTIRYKPGTAMLRLVRLIEHAPSVGQGCSLLVTPLSPRSELCFPQDPASSFPNKGRASPVVWWLELNCGPDTTLWKRIHAGLSMDIIMFLDAKQASSDRYFLLTAYEIMELSIILEAPWETDYRNSSLGIA